jgi:signal transduction histidine kinase
LKQIYEASGHARDFIYKIRAFSQRPPVERRPVALPTVIEESLQILRGVIPEKVGLHAVVQPGCPQVEADAAQLQQVLIDLCVFCWQGLLDRRGAITIALAGQPVIDPSSPALAPGHYACLTIHDDSVGLEEAALKKVFNPFHTRKTSKKIGMELFSARETVLAHQGDLTVQSPPGQGLTFQILLPVMTGERR